jgi:hypothetical protein
VDPKIAVELTRQQEMIERVRQLEAATRLRAAMATVSTVAAEPVDRSLPDLQSRGGLRRAILLREILGPPVGLR